VTRFKLFRLKNAMLFGNAIANLVGIHVVGILSNQTLAPIPAEYAEQIDTVFTPLSFFLVAVCTVFYELPVRRYFSARYHHRTLTPDQQLKARQRLLNEPFVLIAADLSVWLMAAVFFPLILHQLGVGRTVLMRVLVQISLVGLITTIIAFFALEHSLQKRLAPHVFPDGGLASVPNTLRIRIRTRLTAMLVACNLIPFFAMIMIIHGTHYVDLPADEGLAALHTTILINSLIFMAVGIMVSVLVTHNMTRPINEISAVLQNVRRGKLDRKVRVTTSDEIGYTGDVINEMTEGLREREKMRHSLSLAREIQQSLLPGEAPCFKGADIAGRSIYCDQTGGDYFDFLDLDHIQAGTIGLMVGDVSGHGIPSALLMATARAFLRLRSFLPGRLDQVVGDVNRQLCADVGASGQFMTLYYMILNPQQRSLSWVRAGHDAAILYDPQHDRFEELYGAGLALGVDPDFEYTETVKNGLHRDQVVLIGTDGIWEARNRGGQMFGRQALFDIIRKHHSASAGEIIDAVIAALQLFQGDYQTEDDVTLVVFKMLD
jgi:sigma-B regulation protein RsbU (phosphoserine phosphatase)